MRQVFIIRLLDKGHGGFSEYAFYTHSWEEAYERAVEAHPKYQPTHLKKEPLKL
jgi:hypothetical protein